MIDKCPFGVTNEDALIDYTCFSCTFNINGKCERNKLTFTMLMKFMIEEIFS